MIYSVTVYDILSNSQPSITGSLVSAKHLATFSFLDSCCTTKTPSLGTFLCISTVHFYGIQAQYGYNRINWFSIVHYSSLQLFSTFLAYIMHIFSQKY